MKQQQLNFQQLVNVVNDTNDKLNALEHLKTLILYAKWDLEKMKEMPTSVQELLDGYMDYIRKFEGYDDSE